MKRYLSRELLLSLFLTFLVLALYLARTHPSGMLGAGEREKKESLATLVFAGDVMVHDSQIEAAYRPEDGSYSFYSCFEPLKEITARADLAVINLETVLAGEELGYTGYPAFNTPESLARALKEAGFDLVCTANNHSLDRGETGVLKTLEHLEAAGLKSFGTYSSREAREKPLLVETKGIKIAFLAYTYDTNGIPLPENKEYLVNMLDPELIIADIHRVRRRADLVVLYIHWGLEYHREPSPEQQKLASLLFREGADIIVGNHPHVVQPIEFIKFPYRRELKEGVVAYALGNVTGDQIQPYTDSGILLFVRVRMEEPSRKVEIVEVSYVPTWIHRFYRDGRRDFRVLPLLPEESYWRRLEEDPYLTPGNLLQLQQLQEEMREHLRYVPQGLPAETPR
ncbi:MAG TPA: CapA family protein [Bacillota bacterium]|nr:CapA family protein [Bacillota bacterium]HOB86298.1 CapA family protein [Bacillota bacterium]HOP69621.1 CapA family protein [Bacillota bacterium]HPT34698.1 CapA family protein [Bacillota bacterium]HPZ65357.1 CapA family protein [Bacillota bacterium]